MEGHCEICLRYRDVFRSGKMWICIRCSLAIPDTEILTRIAGKRLAD